MSYLSRPPFTIGSLVHGWPVKDREFLSDGWLPDGKDLQLGVVVDYLPDNKEEINRFSVIPLSRARGWRKRGEFCFAAPYQERGFHHLEELEKRAEISGGGQFLVISEDLSESLGIPRVLINTRASSYWQWISNREEFFQARTLDVNSYANVMEFDQALSLMDRTMADNEKLWLELEFLLGVPRYEH